MIKTVWILTFRADKDREEVSRWWRTDHGAIALRVPGIKRYVQNHFLEPLDADRAEGGMPFQGMVECWFDNQETYDAAMASPEWAELEADGDFGFEMTKLYGGFVREHVMRWEGLSDGRVYTTAGDIPAS
jgi:uncharacterized protein (TIGR02118 family)